MITNLIVIVFILLAVVWFSTQGLLSAFLHLIVLLCAGALAFAAWEPLTVNYLLNTMPEYAWGVGLLAPFALFVLLGRIIIDLLVPGNMQFHPLVNSIAGGALGFVIGMITAGVVVIGVQFIGGLSIGGYQPFELVNGQLERKAHLWLGADDFAASVYSGLSGGAFYPMNGNTMAKVHPNLVEAAGAFTLTARPNARTSIRPANVELTRQFTLDGSQLPSDVNIPGKNSLFVVSTHLNLAGTGKVAGAADRDGVFTANPTQVMLLAVDSHGKSHAIPASGFVTANAFGTLTVTGEYARTKAAVDQADIDWIFQVPSDLVKLEHDKWYLRIKQLRLPLTDVKMPPRDDIAQWTADVQWKPAPPAETDNTGNPPTNSTIVEAQRGVGSGLEGTEVEVNDRLPVTLSENWLSSRAGNVDTRNHQLVSAEGAIHIEPDRVDRNLAISQIYHPDNQAIVRMKMTDARARSMYGQVMQFAGQVLPPNLVADDGTTYSAIGYVRYNPGSQEIYLHIDTATPIRAMSQIDINQLKDGESLYLYFRTGRNVHLTKFIVGKASTQEINVNVP